ncbi:MAG: hypothetical protein K2X38_00310 [Gemmataceae bacterium]|nr:hypothetical protein [Gemmataceae bacterium]
MGIDAMGIDATGIDATGIDATGIDATGVDLGLEYRWRPRTHPIGDGDNAVSGLKGLNS